MSKLIDLNVKAASNGMAAVSVIEFCGTPSCYSYAPASIGAWENRAEFIKLFDRAALKLGWKRDRRCRGGFRKLA